MTLPPPTQQTTMQVCESCNRANITLNCQIAAQPHPSHYQQKVKQGSGSLNKSRTYSIQPA